MTLVQMSPIRVLVIEDEPLIALTAASFLHDGGCVVVGPVLRLPDAIEASAHAEFDCAILDVILDGCCADEVAATLARRGKPFAVASGLCDIHLPPNFQAAPKLPKPFVSCDLIAVVRELVNVPPS